MKSFVVCALIFAVLIQCSKKKIEVSDIYLTDSMGISIGGSRNDNQWKSTTFTDKEIGLFNDLDTVNLVGSVLPTIQTATYGFPNPFNHQIGVSATLSQPLNGDVVVKYVVVNSGMTPIKKGAVRTYATSFFGFTVPATFGSGKYRLYYTYSAEGNEHYFKSWGNIQKL